MRQIDVARQLKVHPRSIRAWETNVAKVRVHLIPWVIQFLGYAPYEPLRSFPGWLRTRRTALGLSQERLAKALGMDESTLRKWGVGMHTPTRPSLERLKAFFNSQAQRHCSASQVEQAIHL
ncbi:MAG: helix-turn-helix transcriptional regulator [Acidobacteria bacterium]|nr:helix-turn-helix transcriptional regulator [Acidobacteriota bacterium]